MNTVNSSNKPAPAPTEPPLRALRAFEAFARHGSIAEASMELGVTSSAISHQLSLLETFLQTALTTRHGRSLELNDEGREYYRSISTAFSVLRGATGSIMDKTLPCSVTIAVIPLVATGLLIPHLRKFMDKNTDIQLNVVYSLYRNYLSDSADISIRYGTGDWPGYKCTKLLSGATKPFCSPRFLAKYGKIRQFSDLLSVPLLHDGNRSRWIMWFQSVGIKAPDSSLGPIFEDAQLAASATEAGIGVGLLREALIQRELAQGDLIKLFDAPLHIGLDYYLCVRNDVQLPDAVHRMASWLRTALLV